MKHFSPLIVLLLMSLFLASCQDTVPTRQTISPNNIISNDGTTDDTTEETITRPTGAVLFKSDYCACKDGKATSYGNCSSICASQTKDGIERFFANFTVTSDISLNSGLGNVNGWCTALLPGEDTNPKCVLEAKDELGTVVNLEIISPAGTNSISAVSENLPSDKTLVLTLVETVSGARSDSVQIIKFSADVSLPTLGPLKNAPITQYSCLIREFSQDDSTGDIFFDLAYRLHFYFLPRIPPTPIPAGNSNLICHDIQTQGPLDDDLLPRFEQIPAVFNLWDNSDPRFFDNNGNGFVDANELIIQKAKNFGAIIPNTTNFFTPFIWPGAPELTSDAGNASTNQPIGFYMAPWIDQTTFKSFCLTSAHYNSTNILFRAMKDIIGVDTEGIYIGEKSAESVQLADGTFTTGEKDFILIRETDLKRIWFHIKNGVRTAPTDDNVANVAVFFLFPPNFDSPFVKSSTQRIFRVQSAAQLSGVSGSTNTNAGTASTLSPHDRKIGCVPKF